MQGHFVAPAFGFQKNMPYPDNAALRALIEKQWAVCATVRRQHRLPFRLGQIRRELSGDGPGDRQPSRDQDERPLHLRDGRALSASKNAADPALWRDWYRFTLELALAGRVQLRPPSRRWRARSSPTRWPTRASGLDVFGSPARVPAALEALPPSPDHMFLVRVQFPLRARRRRPPEKAALGDHTPAGYQQRARFYAISPEARLSYLEGSRQLSHLPRRDHRVGPGGALRGHRERLAGYTTLDAMLDDISR